MNPEIIYNQLSSLLEAIQEQYETIRKKEGPIPQIEIDILLENIRKLYDQVHLLNKVRAGHAPPLHPSPQSVTSGHDPSLAAQPSAPPSPILSVERPKSEIRREEQTAKAPKAADLDLFAEEEPTFNMKLKEAREQTMTRKAEPVEHLKQLISINDKFIFINELFDGNLKEYNEAIETLNGFDVRNEAYTYLDLLRTKNLWDLRSGTLMKLKEIVERKY
jgi:hypothetical protein